MTVGGYNTFNHVFKSNNAMSDNPTFTSIQGNLPDMPVYSAVIDVHNPNYIIIGTEFGVWSTTNGSSWTLEDDGMPVVPFHMLRQQYLQVSTKVLSMSELMEGEYSSPSNTSSIFDFTNNDSEKVELLSVFPNPAESFINLDLGSNGTIYEGQIIDLMGKEVLNRLAILLPLLFPL